MPVDFTIETRIAYLKAVAASQAEDEALIQTYRDFWDGEQGVKLTDRQMEYTSTTPESLGNICPRVVSIPKDRLGISPDGIAPADEESVEYSAMATKWWNDDLLLSKQKDLYLASLRDGSAALVVDWNVAEGRPTFTPNLIRSTEEGLIRFHYDNDSNLLFASKQWTITDTINPGQTGKTRLTIYRPGLIDRFEGDTNVAGGWRPLTEQEAGQPNPQFWTDTGTAEGEPLGIPVIPFENPPGSELKDVIIIQEFLNHNLGTMDISIDFHAFPQLWFRGADLPIDSVTGKSILPDFGPGQAIKLNENGAMGHIQAADIKAMFDGGVMTWMKVLGFIKGWPVHFFDNSVLPPSGVALIQQEASIVQQVVDKQNVFSGAWSRAFDIGRKLHRMHKDDELLGALRFNWDSPMTNDGLAVAQEMKTRFEALQLPIISRWRDAGMSEAQIEQAIEDAQREDEFGLVTGVEQ